MKRKKGSRGRGKKSVVGPLVLGRDPRRSNDMKSGSNSVSVESLNSKRHEKDCYIMADDREINLVIAPKIVEEASRGASVDQIWDIIHDSLNSRSPRPWGSRMWRFEDTRWRGIALIKCCKAIKEFIAQRNLQDEEDDSLVSILSETKDLECRYTWHVRRNKLQVYHILEDHLNLLDAYIEEEERFKEYTCVEKVAWCVRAILPLEDTNPAKFSKALHRVINVSLYREDLFSLKDPELVRRFVLTQVGNQN